VIEVRWTPEASEDLQAIYDFIARDSEHYANLVFETILSSIDKIERFPLIGRKLPELAREDIREIIHPPYRIVYRIDQAAHILTVVRTSRLLSL
jgi:toxin ParE1/3/4